jgi:SAM-dependent methyltransferase
MTAMKNDEATSAYQWTGARGDKWRATLTGMEATLAPLDEPLLEALELGDGPLRIADVGCGGGGTTLALARRAPAGSVVRGFDISPALIAAARERPRDADVDVTFEVADAAKALPVDAPFDRLASRLGVMFFDDPPAAFANLARWLAPGGRLAFVVWGRTADNPWMTSVRDAAAPVIDVPRPEPDSPGPFRYGHPEPLLALLAGAGFRDVQARAWQGQLPIGGGLPPAAAAEFALASFSSFAEQLAKAGPGAHARVLSSLATRFEASQRDGVVWLDGRAHVVTAAR